MARLVRIVIRSCADITPTVRQRAFTAMTALFSGGLFAGYCCPSSVFVGENAHEWIARFEANETVELSNEIADFGDDEGDENAEPESNNAVTPVGGARAKRYV
jgi:hypothetical protein